MRRATVLEKIFGVVALTAFLLIIGTVGAMEHGHLPLLPGTIRAFGFIVLWAVSTRLAGGFKWEEGNAKDDRGSDNRWL